MRTARLAAGRPGACRKSLFDTLSNETRFTGLSFEWGSGSLQRTKGTPAACPSHVCEPSGIFSDVHAAGENDSYFLCACERKLCEALYTD